MKRKRKRDLSFERRERQIIKVDLEADIGFGRPLDVYIMGGCTIYVGSTDVGWHLAISHPSRYPTWEEVMDARYNLIPENVNMAMILPPEQSYLEVHPNMLQLWQVKTDLGKGLNA